MSDNHLDFIDDVIRFLENEREIYGDFTVAGFSPGDKNDTSVSDSQEKIKTESPSADTKNYNPENLLKQCSTLEELRSLCETADVLRTDLDGTNLVFGVGNQNADLMLIGEAPGEQEDRQGEPFVGAAGQLLNKILEAVKFRREDVYIANILKHRPPGNRNPNPEERQRSLPYLLRQIELIQPKLILCLGKISGITLLNRDTTLRSLRGKYYPFHGAELTVTYHPAALLRHPKWKRPVWEDVQKLREKYDELGGKP
ncbi:MAG: uracil-DNA glycosylase [Balneolaceae bacterium]